MNIPFTFTSRKVLTFAISVGLLTSLVATAPSASAIGGPWTVTYNANGGSGTAPSDNTSYPDLTTVSVAGQGGLYRNGYTFGGWSYSSGFSQPSVVSSFTITQNTTLTAVWNAITYGVTYNGNGFTGGTLPVDNARYALGTTVAVAGQNGISRTGYTFGGWSYSGGLGPSVVTSFAIQADTTLTAVWNAVATLTMTYTSGTGATGLPPTDTAGPYSSGATVIVLGAGTLAKAGYSFGGWMDCVVNTHYGATFTILGNTVVCPVWTINPYAVHYLATGSTTGTPPSDPNSPYVSGATVTVLGAGSLVKTGYNFGG